MPELPEVETTVRGLASVLDGRRIMRIETRREGLRRPFPADLVQRMQGARVTGLSRRAKYGLVHSDRGGVMIFHLGMSGRWRIDPETIDKHDHLLIETDEGHLLALNDARRFGSVDVADEAGLAQHPLFAGLGPEPLAGPWGQGITAAHLAAAFKGRSAPAKALLLDQRTVAGLGNIYVCEALHMAGIAPARAGAKVAKARFEPLAAAIHQVLEAAIEAGGSTLRDYARPDGELGYFAKDWRVYGRAGADCPACGGVVERLVQSGRSSFWCRGCQK